MSAAQRPKQLAMPANAAHIPMAAVEQSIAPDAPLLLPAAPDNALRLTASGALSGLATQRAGPETKLEPALIRRPFTVGLLVQVQARNPARRLVAS